MSAQCRDVCSLRATLRLKTSNNSDQDRLGRRTVDVAEVSPQKNTKRGIMHWSTLRLEAEDGADSTSLCLVLLLVRMSQMTETMNQNFRLRSLKIVPNE